jgi:diguanylate cyclase (GGDEF)-like protein
MSQVHPLTLRFRDNILEQKFLQTTLERTRSQGQVAMLVGIFVYLLHSALDQWLVPPEQMAYVWMVRLAALCVPTFVLTLTLTLTPWFALLCHPLLAAVGLAAGTGFICMQLFMSVESSAYFYPNMVLVTFYTYNFIGTRFIFAFGVDMAMLIAYNMLFGWVLDYPPHILLVHNFFLVSANLAGGTAGYLAERQRRALFLRERELDYERQHHLTRSLHDGLTGLPNRELLYDRIAQAIAESQRKNSIHCGFFLDIDGFKAINDKLTHEVGDRVLKNVAIRLTSAIRSTDTLARIGGDEFFILAPDIDCKEAAYALAEKLLNQFSTPLPEIPAEMSIGVSIGLCLFPYEGMTVSDLIHRSDEAMYKVKCGGKGYFLLAETPVAT